jgi:HK97 family phage prohead protease
VDTKSLRVELKDADEDKGIVSAVFSTFNVKDKDGDVTKPGAFESGAEVLISAYQHQSWGGALPVGKGTISANRKEATFNGQFFMDTQGGADTFKVVKAAGALMEWSYGFDPVEYKFGEHEGERVRFLLKQKVHEVSPVLIGAGENTRTLSAKSAGRAQGDEKCVRCGHQFTKGEFYANAPTDHDDVSVVVCPGCTGTKFADEAAAVVAAVKALSDRAADVMAKRQEKGKALGADSTALLEQIHTEVKRLEELLAAEPTPEHEDALTQEFLRYVSRRVG